MTPTKPRFRITFKAFRCKGVRLGVAAMSFKWYANEWVDGPNEKGVCFTLDLLFVTLKCNIYREDAYYTP
jgi:hypothetical protein